MKKIKLEDFNKLNLLEQLVMDGFGLIIQHMVTQFQLVKKCQ
jgi:hypothetical protein